MKVFSLEGNMSVQKLHNKILCQLLRNRRYYLQLIITIEVIEAESQAVLNALTEHDFQDAFKNGRSTGNGAHATEGNYCEGDSGRYTQS
jgi:hypothetical protein